MDSGFWNSTSKFKSKGTAEVEEREVPFLRDINNTLSSFQLLRHILELLHSELRLSDISFDVILGSRLFKILAHDPFELSWIPARSPPSIHFLDGSNLWLAPSRASRCALLMWKSCSADSRVNQTRVTSKSSGRQAELGRKSRR